MRGARIVWFLAGIFCLVGCGGDRAKPRRAPAADGRLVMVSSLTTPPYSYRDASGAPAGIDIDIVAAAARRLGLEFEVREMSFSPMIQTVKSGVADCAASAITITAARTHDVDFSVPYASDGSAFLYRAGARMPTIPTAAGLRIGTQVATVAHFFLCRCELNPICEETYDELVRHFESGRLDAVFYDAAAIRATVAASEGRYAISPLVLRENYGIAVRKDFPALREALDAVIRERSAGR